MTSKSSRKANAQLTTVNTRTVGIDVHKDRFVACFEMVEATSSQGDRSKEAIQYEFKTVAGCQDQRAELIDWIKRRNPEVIILESTGIYWKAIFREMEEAGLQPSLINPRHFHRPDEGRKTDTADAQFLANLGRIGLFRASFVPPEPYRTLRLFVVAHHKNTSSLTADKNRLQKILDDAGIHLGSVFSDPSEGRSAKAVLQLLIEDRLTAENIETRISGRRKASAEEIMQACQGKLSPAQRQLLRMYKERIDLTTRQNQELEECMQKTLSEDNWAIELLQTIPGVDRQAAVELVSIFGPDPSEFFPNSSAFARWAGVCPGNNESAGVRKSSQCPHGLKTVKTIVIECAQAAIKSKNTRFKATFITKRCKGYCQAVMAVAHQMLRVIYAMLSTHSMYDDSNFDFESSADQRKRHVPRWVRQRRKLLLEYVDVLANGVHSF